MPAVRSYLGIDVGTSVTKAVLLDEAGTLLAAESAQTQLLSPRAGWFEEDPADIHAAVVQAVRAIVTGTGARPAAVGITGQGDGLWLADAAGCAVRPAVSWLDSRAADVLERWQAAGLVEDVFHRTGNVLFPGSAAPLLSWFAAHERRSLDGAATAGYCKDLLMQRLTGVRSTDASDASLPFLDPRTRTYDTAVLELLGLGEWASLLAPVCEPLPVGELRADAAELLGLPAGTPVTCGPFDLPASAVGAGLTVPGVGLVTIGTTLACQVLVDAVDRTGEPAGMTLATGTPGRWLRAMPAMVGTAALDWLLTVVGRTHADLDAMLAESPLGAHGVTCLPYFSPAGERAPFLAPQARAGFDRLSMQTTVADLVRATCEAIVYAARQCFEAAGLTGDVAACGGGTASAGWLQMFADVLGRPVQIAARPETGARGAVTSAVRVLGHDVDTAVWTAPERVVEPVPANVERYAEQYLGYCDRVAKARQAWRELG
ncbi:MAG: carbohydrate kinase [Streptosporangiales bacterium]|nr:carbohydrate kinase [Streptosporangiales bacterium]